MAKITLNKESLLDMLLEKRIKQRDEVFSKETEQCYEEWLSALSKKAGAEIAKDISQNLDIMFILVQSNEDGFKDGFDAAFSLMHTLQSFISNQDRSPLNALMK